MVSARVRRLPLFLTVMAVLAECCIRTVLSPHYVAACDTQMLMGAVRELARVILDEN